MPAAVNVVLDGGNLDKILIECEKQDKEIQIHSCFSGMPQESMKNFPHTKQVGNYLVGKMINKGSFAKVMEGLHIPTGEKVAIKVIDKKKAKQESYLIRNMKREPRIQQMIRHPNIVQLYETLETENSYYMVMELCLGGDLLNQICHKKKLEERDVRKYTRQIMSAVEHLHRYGIVHRDLKIENFLLDESNNIKIVDFGLSNTIKAVGLLQELLNTQCGSPAYAAPELLSNKKYGPKVDVWSIGVCIFAMLTGTLPFSVDPFNIKQLYRKIINGDIGPIPPEMSEGAFHLIYTLLEPDPIKRPTVKEAMEDQWLNKGFTRKPLSSISYKNRLRPDELNSTVLNYMTTTMDVSIMEITNVLVNNKPSPVMASYCLLLKKIVKNQMKYRLSKKNESNKWSLLYRMPWLDSTDNYAVHQHHLLENEVLDKKHDSDHIKCIKNQDDVQLEEVFLQNENPEVKNKKSPTLYEPIQEDEITLNIDNQENVLKASRFAGREMVSLEPPYSSQQQKMDTSATPLSNKDLNQLEGNQEGNKYFAARQNSIQSKTNQSTKLQTQQAYNPSCSHIARKIILPVEKHVNETPIQKQGARLQDSKSTDDNVPPNCCQQQNRGSPNLVMPSHQSTLPKLRQPAQRDNHTKRVSWVTSSQHAKTGSSPFVISGTKPPVFPMSRQKNIIAKSLGQSKEKSHLALDSSKAKRNVVQLTPAHKTINLNFPLLAPTYQKRSEKSKDILRLQFL